MQVVYNDGIIVRSTAKIETGEVVKIVHPGDILKATGKVRGGGDFMGFFVVFVFLFYFSVFDVLYLSQRAFFFYL